MTWTHIEHTDKADGRKRYFKLGSDDSNAQIALCAKVCDESQGAVDAQLADGVTRGSCFSYWRYVSLPSA